MKPSIRLYLLQVAIAFDRLGNAFLGGSADETLSSHAHRMRLKQRPLWSLFAAFVDWAFWHLAEHVDHCRAAWELEIRRRNPSVKTDTAGARLALYDPLP